MANIYFSTILTSIPKSNNYNFIKELKIGWYDNYIYYFVTDELLFELKQIYYLDFVYNIQNNNNLGWEINYTIQNEGYFVVNHIEYKKLKLIIKCDESKFYKRLKSNELYYFENVFIYNILAEKTYKIYGFKSIITEWKDSWVNNNNKIISQPKCFDKDIKLFEYQLKSLKWAIDIENKKYKSKFYGNTSLSLLTKDNNLSKISFDMVDKKFINNEYEGHNQITDGGILADEMGLGKTITCIAIIAKNPKVIKPNIKL